MGLWVDQWTRWWMNTWTMTPSHSNNWKAVSLHLKLFTLKCFIQIIRDEVKHYAPSSWWAKSKHRLLIMNLRNGIGNEWIWENTPCYTRSQVLCDNWRVPVHVHLCHPPHFAKSGLVLPSDDSLAVSAALPAWIGIRLQHQRRRNAF